MITPRISRMWLAGAAFFLCCDAQPPSAPTSDPEQPGAVMLSVVGGDEQIGPYGHELLEPLVVQCEDATGSSNPEEDNDDQGGKSGRKSDGVSNCVVSWHATDGGSVFSGVSLTDADGYAREWWTLGPQNGWQQLEVRSVDPSTGEKKTHATFRALALPPEPMVTHRDGDLWVVNNDGENEWQLTNSPDEDSDPVWSPDLRKILFVRKAEGSLYTDIWVMDSDGSNLVNLTNHPSQNIQPAWAPDGSAVAFVSDRSGAVGLYTMSSDGSGVFLVREFEPYTHLSSDVSPSWSPDGSHLAFYQEQRNDFTPYLYFIASDGTGFQQVPFPAPDVDSPYLGLGPAWSPDGMQVLVRGSWYDQYGYYISAISQPSCSSTSMEQEHRSSPTVRAISSCPPRGLQTGASPG